MRIYRIYFFIFILIVHTSILSCTSNELDSKRDDQPVTLPIEGSNFKFYTDPNLYNSLQANRSLRSSDIFAISEVKRSKEALNIKVTYNGGHVAHDFDVVWDGVINLSESGKVNLMVRHKNNGDNGREIISQKLEIDLPKFFNNLVDKDNILISVSNASILQRVNSRGQVTNE